MKKKITFLFASVLIALTMIMTCIADEPTTEMVTDITTELVTDILTEPTETPTEGETASGVATTPTDEENAPTGENSAPAEDANDEWETFKARITDSATWTMIGTALVTILTTVGAVKSKFDKISSLVHNKADNDTLKDELKKMEKDLKEAYNANRAECRADFAAFEDAVIAAQVELLSFEESVTDEQS